MKKIILIIFSVTSIIFCQAKFNSSINFDDYFIEKTLRLDFYHTGNKDTEIISFDKLVEEENWSGSKKNLIDTFYYGNYMLKVYNESKSNLIYSRGFSTLFQEWQTTEEAKTTWRSFQGSVIMPFPKKNIIVEIDRRDKKNNFKKIFEYLVNPNNYFIIKEKLKTYPNFKVHYSGEPTKKLDIVFIPEGYTDKEMEKFKNDCQRFSEYLFDYSPFLEYKDKINIWGVEAPSLQSGTDIPGKGVWVQTLLNSSFYTFDSERYLMTTDYFTVRDIAANAPYDQIFILVNTSKYGGGGIYNYYNITAVDDNHSKQIFIHEFGHGLAGLADEYGNDNTYQDFYPLDVEPWEPNLTTLVNFDIKWKDLVDSDTPIPTPSEDKYKNKIGVFEGGGYVAKGVYRPTFNSIMNSFTSNEFNEVCKRVLRNIINFYSE